MNSFLDSNLLILIFGILGLLTLGSLLAIVWNKVDSLKEDANKHLIPQDLYWQEFRLYDIPKNGRDEFFAARGHQAGVLRGIRYDGLSVLFAGLIVAGLWLRYPAKKKRALSRLAESASLSKDDVLKIANDLRS